jgi:hypothetical protein
MKLAVLTYSLCGIAALGCMILLLRAYRRVGTRLLLWSGLCFACFTLNNGLIVVDHVILPGSNLFLLRNLAAMAGVSVLLYGLIWDAG